MKALVPVFLRTLEGPFSLFFGEDTTDSTRGVRGISFLTLPCGPRGWFELLQNRIPSTKAVLHFISHGVRVNHLLTYVLHPVAFSPLSYGCVISGWRCCCRSTSLRMLWHRKPSTWTCSCRMDNNLCGSEVLGERGAEGIYGSAAGITQGLDVEGEKAQLLNAGERYEPANIFSLTLAALASPLRSATCCQCCLGRFSPCFPVRFMSMSPSQLSRR